MPRSFDDYKDQVEHIEANLGSFAKKSFEPWSPTFIDGSEIFKQYSDEWQTPQRKRLLNRTPLQRERDRILHSTNLRRQTEKYHVLYSGPHRIVRNYTTHTMRMSQVTRAICRALELNSDFAEALVLGSKIGAVPFVHAAKREISEFLRKRLLQIDKRNIDAGKQKRLSHTQYSLQFDLDSDPVPVFLRELQSHDAFERAIRYIPWAVGKNVDETYTSGQESYWLITSNPFTRTAGRTTYSPETMFGIWRHSRGLPSGRESFRHTITFDCVPRKTISFSAEHLTYESIVVQYADDITWAIENLNDANVPYTLHKGSSLYQMLRQRLKDHDVPESVKIALADNDSGGLYTFFITDFIESASATLSKLQSEHADRRALISDDENALIGLSPIGRNVLEQLIKFLDRHVFGEIRTKNRTAMLKTITRACIELLVDESSPFLTERIEQKRRLGFLTQEEAEESLWRLTDEIHRLQLAVDTLADMSDQEVFDCVGFPAAW